MQFDETPLSAEPERIRKVLLQEIPTWSPVYVVPMAAGFLASLLVVSVTGVAVSWGVAMSQGTPFPNPSTWGVVLGVFLVALLVGWLAPRPSRRFTGLRHGERGAGCLSLLVPLYGGNLFDTAVFLVKGPQMGPAGLELATTVVAACLARPGADRARIVKAVQKMVAGTESAKVEFILRKLTEHEIVEGKTMIRVPPSRIRDFGALDTL